jgi:hypothetical protein
MIASCDRGSRKELNIGAQLLVPEVAFGSLRRLAVAEFLFAVRAKAGIDPSEPFKAAQNCGSASHMYRRASPE